nr:hypothetical protein [Bradyrhizobium retamae]
MGNLPLDPFGRGSEALVFRGRPALFRSDLSLDHLALPRQRCENGGIDVIAVGADLGSDYGQERVALGNLLTLLDVELFDETLVWNENFGRSEGRR